LLPPLQNPPDLLNDTQFDLPEIPTNSPLKKKFVSTSNNNTGSNVQTPPVDDPNDFDALARRLDALKRK
jgi:hypothetical protein